MTATAIDCTDSLNKTLILFKKIYSTHECPIIYSCESSLPSDVLNVSNKPAVKLEMLHKQQVMYLVY